MGQIEMSKPLKIEEVALIVGVSTQTLNNWYRWARLNPEDSMAKLLPAYTQIGGRQTRYWKQSDVWDIITFRNSIPHGRNGILGDITQKGARKRREEVKNGKQS